MVVFARPLDDQLVTSSLTHLGICTPPLVFVFSLSLEVLFIRDVMPCCVLFLVAGPEEGLTRSKRNA